MKDRLFSTLWFGMSALAIGLFMQFIPSLVSPEFYWPTLHFGFFEILLIVSSGLVGAWLGPKILALKLQKKTFFEMTCITFDILGYGLLGGFINLIIPYLLILITARSPVGPEFGQALIMFFMMGGWAIVILWMMFAWLFWLVNFLLHKTQQSGF